MIALVFLPAAAFAAGRFGDVPPDSRFAGDIAWLADHGLTAGCNSDGTLFCPSDPVTRQQLAAMLHELARGRAIDAGTVDGLSAAELKGSRGPTGPAGPAGPAGPQGPAGSSVWTGSRYLAASANLVDAGDGKGYTEPQEPPSGTWLHPEMFPSATGHTLYLQLRPAPGSELCGYVRVRGSDTDLASQCATNDSEGMKTFETKVTLDLLAGWNEYYVTYSETAWDTSTYAMGQAEAVLWSTTSPVGAPPERPDHAGY